MVYFTWVVTILLYFIEIIIIFLIWDLFNLFNYLKNKKQESGIEKYCIDILLEEAYSLYIVSIFNDIFYKKLDF